MLRDRCDQTASPKLAVIVPATTICDCQQGDDPAWWSSNLGPADRWAALGTRRPTMLITSGHPVSELRSALEGSQRNVGTNDPSTRHTVSTIWLPTSSAEQPSTSTKKAPIPCA